MKQMAIKYFQQWAVAFKPKRELSFFVDVYNELMNSGTFGKLPCHPSVTDISRYRLPTGTRPNLLCPARNDHSTPVGRFGRLHAMSFSLHLHQPETPLPELRSRLRPSVLIQDSSLATLWDNHSRASVRFLFCQRRRAQGVYICWTCTGRSLRPDTAEQGGFRCGSSKGNRAVFGREQGERTVVHGE